MEVKSAVELFKTTFGEEATIRAKAPGRLEVLGNHTDYNDGITLSCAVSQATEFVMRPIEGKTCSIISSMTGEVTKFDLDKIDTPIKGDWTNYVKGVIIQLRKRGIDVPAFQAAVHSTVPLSAGMSSSAALEVATGYAFSKAFNIELSKTEWAKIGQGVENEYIGLGSGLLDQFSSVFGKKNSLIYSDFRTNEVIRNVSIPDGYVLVVANSLVKHDLVDSDYNVRRKSCMNVAEKMSTLYENVKALRDVTPEMLIESKDQHDPVDFRRALHVVGECDRVIKGVDALENGDINTFAKLLYDSHQSSIDNFENSCKELDVLVELSKEHEACLGSRLSGGGFGGISIHLVKENKAEEYCSYLEGAYESKMGKKTETIICLIGEGAFVESL